MEDFYLPAKSLTHLRHLPTYILIIGYPVFWLEMYFHQNNWGVTTPLAIVVLAVMVLFMTVRSWRYLQEERVSFFEYFEKAGLFEKFYLVTGGVLVIAVLIIGFMAATLPPHLSQEYDALNYHLTIPRQHLILNSFRHIPWSTADLFPLPVDFALAPYWFVTALPNKISQFVFLLALIAVSKNLCQRFSPNGYPARILVCFAILGSHCFGVQIGTAMLDIVLCYLFIAAIDSFLAGAIFLSAVEFTFYFWSKSFVPPQTIFIIAIVGGLILVLKKAGFKILTWDFDQELTVQEMKALWAALKNFFKIFLVLSILIGGPFIIKSTVCSGTPLYPFKPGLIKLNPNIDDHSKHWESLMGATKTHMTTKDQYGHGRSLGSFIKHFWLVAVPEKGVNNTFDYPLGLMFLVFLGPFFMLIAQSLKKGEIPLLPLWAVVFWLSWWMGSQQARFLYIPLVLIYLTVGTGFKFQTKIFKCAVTLSMFLAVLSVYRAHKPDFGKSSWEVLRDKDKTVVEMSKRQIADGKMESVNLEYHDVPYAQFPVTVTKEKWPYVIAMDEDEKGLND